MFVKTIKIKKKQKNKKKEPILLIHPVRGGRGWGGSCHIKVTAYWPSRLGVEIADFDLT